MRFSPRLVAVLLSGTTVLVVGGCRAAAPTPADVWNRATDLESARSLMESIPPTLAVAGPAGWLDIFEGSASFFMASDGAVTFGDADSLRTFLASFAPTVSAMTLEWGEMKIEPLAPGVTAVAASYTEEITMTDGGTDRFGGYVTGVARSSGGRWRVQHLHWSSPPAPTP